MISGHADGIETRLLRLQTLWPEITRSRSTGLERARRSATTVETDAAVQEEMRRLLDRRER